MKDMNYNYEVLLERIKRSQKIVTYQDLEKLDKCLGNIVSIGTGGSYPIAKFSEMALKSKDRFIKSVNPRDLLGGEKEKLDNVLIFSYSGSTPSIMDVLMDMKDVKKLILTFDDSKLKKYFSCDEIICYNDSLEKERSFISIASTLIPMGLLFKYRLMKNGKSEEEVMDIISEIFDKSQEEIEKLEFGDDFRTVEVFGGDVCNTASSILRSTLIESGMGYPVLYDKNDYGHGCVNLNFYNKTDFAIYLMGDMTEIDLMMNEVVLPMYKDVVLLKSNSYDFKNDDNKHIIDEFDLSVKSFYLLRKMALKKEINLSDIKYPEENIKIYKYNGNMNW